LQSDADEVVALARKAVAGAKDAAGAARQIQDFVGKYVNRKDLSVGYATALEVAKSRQGDCSEHAVLAAAMCRAAGLPAQVVVGVAYVENFGGHKDVFGPHAWFRVLIDGVWVDYDAALGSYDAGHIALFAGDGDPSDFFGVVNTLGNFRIAEAKKN
jgi:transglutaminase-like putative cysteine protease